MKQFFNKSGLLFSVIIPFSVILILCAIGYFNQNSLVYPISGLSEDYVIFYDENNEGITMENYKKQLEGCQDDVTKGIKCEEGSAVAFEKDYEGLNLVQGRIFSQEEYREEKDVILVSEETLMLCEKENRKIFFTLYGVRYEVVGVYESDNQGDMRNSPFIINLTAKRLNLTPSYGFVDGESVEGVKENVSEKMEVVKAKAAVDFLNKNILIPIENMIYIFLAVAIFVLLNIFNAIAVWMRGKRKEIVIRKMIGARRHQIYWWLIRNYMTFVCIGFGISLVLVIGIMKALNQWKVSSSLLVMLGNTVKWEGVAISFVGISISLFAIIVFMVRKYLKNEIIQYIR